MSKRRTSMRIYRTVVSLFYWSALFIAVITFSIALVANPTDKDPSGFAGVSAALIALFTAAMVTAQATNAGKGLIRQVKMFCIGLGAMASAYLWIAAEAGVHPSEPSLPVYLLVIGGLAAPAVVAIPLFTLVWEQLANNQSPNGEQDNC